MLSLLKSIAEPLGSAFFTRDILPYFYMATAIMSLITFVLFGLDKKKARKKAWRISELALLTFSFLLGAPGGLLGMLVFRHKTKKPIFNITVPVLAILYLSLVFFFNS